MKSSAPKAPAAPAAPLKSSKTAKARAARRQVSYRSPRLTINKSLPVFLFVGVLFTSVGSVILYIFRDAEEVVIDYTHCTSVSNASQPCSEAVGPSPAYEKCWCEVPFSIENEMKEPVFLFYGLVTFFQAPRQPVLQASSQQPANHSEAEFFMFADSLTVYSVESSMYVPLVRTGVAWPDMRCGKCSRHSPVNLRRTHANFTRSMVHADVVADLDPQSFENEDFMVWMQPVAAATFAKLYRGLNYGTTFNGSLPSGEYRLLVTYTYPVNAWSGSKSLIVANSTILGAKNMLLGIAYVATGCICLVISIIFCGMRLRKKMQLKKKAHELSKNK